MIRKAAVDIFDEVKERVSIANIFSFYGVAVNSHNKAVCCFHKEKTPSMTVYPASNSFYCFGCGIGGSSIDFVSKYYNLEPLEAAKKIDIDFNLGVTGMEPTAEHIAKISERERENKLVSDFKKWEAEYFKYLVENIRLLDQLEEISNPSCCDGVFTDNFAYSISRRQLLEYHRDILLSGSTEEKISLYSDMGEAVNH